MINPRSAAAFNCPKALALELLGECMGGLLCGVVLCSFSFVVIVTRTL